jgi:pro-apoptotic serine protease NMA111
MCASRSAARSRCRARSCSSIRCTILAVVSYDPAAIGNTPVRAAVFDTRELTPGQDVWVVGERSDSKIMSQRTQVASLDVLSFPLSRTLRFRDTNLEAVNLVNPPGDFDGVIANEKGEVLALWSSFAFENQRDLEQVNHGIPADIVTEMIDAVIANRPLYSFEAEFNLQSLAGARKLGLPDSWVRRFEEHNPQRRQVLGIDRLVAGSPAARLLEPGDLVLAIDGKIVNRFREVERAVQKPEIAVTVWRDGAEKTLQAATVPLNGRDIDRVLIWAGATLQAPHRAMAAQRGIAPGRRFCRVLLLRIAGDPLRVVCGPAHHRGRRPADARPRRVHQGGSRQARSILAAAENHQLERTSRRHHAEAR